MTISYSKIKIYFSLKVLSFVIQKVPINKSNKKKKKIGKSFKLNYVKANFNTF